MFKSGWYLNAVRRNAVGWASWQVYFVRALMAVVVALSMGIFCSSAQAGITCNTSYGNNSVTAGTMTIAPNTTPGTLIKSLTGKQIYINCAFVSSSTPAGESSRTANARFRVSGTLASGFTDVYTTNIAGVGIRYLLRAPDCSVPSATAIANQLTLYCPFTGTIDSGTYTFKQVYITQEIVLIGNAPASATLNSVPAITLDIADSVGTFWAQTNPYNTTASGTFTGKTCSVVQKNVSVDLDPVKKVDLASVGAVAGAKSFNLDLNCQAGIKVYITLTDNVTPSNRGNVLTLTGDSVARGVGIQLTNNSGAPVNFGPDSSSAGNLNQWMVGNATGGAMQVPLSAQYIRTGAITAGPLKALATFTMSYQ